MTSVGYSKMGIHVVLSFAFFSLKHVLLAIQVDNKWFFFFLTGVHEPEVYDDLAEEGKLNIQL